MYSIRSKIGLLVSVVAIAVSAWGATPNQVANQLQSASHQPNGAAAAWACPTGNSELC